MLRADHPSNNKRGGVCIFYRITLPLRVLNIPYLSECHTFEISIGNKVCRFIHRSPNQTQDEFQTFKSNLKLNLDALLCGNPFPTVMIGDFYAKSKDWCSIDITSFEGSELDVLTSQFGLSQLIKEPAHILDNSRSCIDLIKYQNYGLERKQSEEKFWCNFALKYCLNSSDKLKNFDTIMILLHMILYYL